MDNESIYTLTEAADSLIDAGIDTMGEWLDGLNDEELAVFYRMCQKKPHKRNGQEDYEICRYSLVLYCREVGLNELGLNSEFVNKTTGTFCINVVVEALKRQGLVETNGPILLYKKTEIKLIDRED